MDVLMPQLGETVTEGKITKWFKSAGDAVKPGDNLFEIETDKTSMEVPATAPGVLTEIRVGAGEVVPVGAIVAIIAGEGAAVAPQAASTPAAKTSPPLIPAKAGIQASGGVDPRLRGDERTIAKPAIPMDPFREVRTPERNYGPAKLASGNFTTPLARRLAGEAGIDLANVKGSGPHGRIVAADVATAKAPARAHVASAEAAPMASHVVLTADVAVGQSLALCEQANAEQKLDLQLADLIVKAWATALQRVTPSEHADIALAIGASRGALRDVADQSLTAISAARREPPGETGTTTAISMPDVPGIVSVADLLRPPHTTMLSIGAPRRAPVEAADGSVRFVSVVTATLLCDARVVDAALGAALLSAFKGYVEQPVTMLV
jgi:pyruvate dehydrogenase E2 component (dihydrolipoamide acetyltransferase)